MTFLNFTMTLSLLLGVLLGLFIAILGFLLSLTWSQRPARSDRQPERALPETIERNPTPEGSLSRFSTMGGEPKLEKRQSKGRLSSDPIQPIRSKAVENAVCGTSAPAHAGKARGRPTCFRITGVPSHWGKTELEEKLAEIDPNLEIVNLSIFQACICSTKTKTALLRLRNTTNLDKWEEEPIVLEPSQTGQLNIDKDFYGLTPLNDPDTPITAEFVPLHILHHCLAR